MGEMKGYSSMPAYDVCGATGLLHVGVSFVEALHHSGYLASMGYDVTVRRSRCRLLKKDAAWKLRPYVVTSAPTCSRCGAAPDEQMGGDRVCSACLLQETIEGIEALQSS